VAVGFEIACASVHPAASLDMLRFSHHIFRILKDASLLSIMFVPFPNRHEQHH
jgi:hypothetical protein